MSPKKDEEKSIVNDSRAASDTSVEPEIELFDKDGNRVDTDSLLKRLMSHPLTQEMYGMNKTAFVNQGKAKLGEVILQTAEYKMIRPFLPEGAVKVLDGKITGAVFRLFLGQGIGFALAVLSNYVPDGKFRKAAKLGAEAVINGAWDSTVTPDDVTKFLNSLFSGDVFKIMGQIDPTLLEDGAK